MRHFACWLRAANNRCQRLHGGEVTSYFDDEGDVNRVIWHRPDMRYKFWITVAARSIQTVKDARRLRAWVTSQHTPALLAVPPEIVEMHAQTH